MVWKDWLPDFKGALKGFYEESLKETVETRTTEFKHLLVENMEFGKRTQQIGIALGIGIFLLIAIAYFWRED